HWARTSCTRATSCGRSATTLASWVADVAGWNLSEIAVRNRSVTLFLILAVLVAGALAFRQLGRAEDPSFTVKVMTVSAVWPGATAAEMQEQIADRLEKRLQELAYYDRVETTSQP